jgi:hypothetical protein
MNRGCTFAGTPVLFQKRPVSGYWCVTGSRNPFIVDNRVTQRPLMLYFIG